MNAGAIRLRDREAEFEKLCSRIDLEASKPPITSIS